MVIPAPSFILIHVHVVQSLDNCYNNNNKNGVCLFLSSLPSGDAHAKLGL